ncbi:MAG: phosphotransferase [Methanomassiliicoccus sp.]|nr:phosphotransferase [Methanomassiliicoccus sp.]
MSILEPQYEFVEAGDSKIMKLFPAGTARAVAERELEMTMLAKRYGLETPFVHGIVEVDGRWGLQFDKVLGPTFTQWMVQHPDWLGRLTGYFAHEHHEVHMHKVPELPRLKEMLAGLLDREEGLDGDEREDLVKKLARMPDGDWLCHMAFVPESITVSIDGPVVFNWGGAMRGDYIADVAMTSLLLERWTPKPEEKEAVDRFIDMFRHGYLAEYLKICGRMDEDVDRWKEIIRPVMRTP